MVSEEYISREVAIKEFERYGAEDDAIAVFNSIPAADVRPVKRGKWIAQYSGSHFAQYRCSCCNMACEMVFNFCPNCGAAMEG